MPIGQKGAISPPGRLLSDIARPRSNLSNVMGRSRIRLPVALKTALATAAATPVMPISFEGLDNKVDEDTRL